MPSRALTSSGLAPSRTSEATILKALAIAPNTSTLTFDADAALARLHDVPSIKTATIRKVYPGEIQVAITEKVPMARWRIGDKSYLVDEDGSPVALDDGSFREFDFHRVDDLQVGDRVKWEGGQLYRM